MNSSKAGASKGLRYRPDDRLPPMLALGLGLQLAVLTVAISILVPTIVMRAGGAPEAYAVWAVFAAVVICGVTTALQAVRYGRIGSGLVLVMGSEAAYIWPCIAALEAGGPALLAALVVVSSPLLFVLSRWIAHSRRLLTSTVMGTVCMLVPVTAMPVVFEMLSGVPDGSPTHATPASTFATILVIVGIALKGGPRLRIWAPIVGVACGSFVAGMTGLYDVERVAAAPWIGLVDVRWPGIDLEFGLGFRSLLPVFVLLIPIVAVRTISSGVAVHGATWGQQRAVDFRAVQGSMNVNAISNLLSGLAGTVPNSAMSVSASLTELTGVAARSVGIVTGALFVALAFSPKALAVVLAIPGAVVGGFLAVLLAMLFMVGIKVLLEDGLDFRKSLIAGFAFWVGVGCQNGMIYPAQVAEFAGGVFANGMIAGGLTAIAMTLFAELTGSRPRRMETAFDVASLPEIRVFLRSFALRAGWAPAMAERIEAAAEEALLSLVSSEEGGVRSGRWRRLRVAASRADGNAVLEFVVTPRPGNVQDRLAMLAEPGDEPSIERDVSLRLLRHLASTVRHRQYHDVDIVTVRVDGSVPDDER